MTEIVLGLDGGGTKVLAQAASCEGRVLGQGAAGACNIAFMPLADALAHALAAARSALAEADCRSEDVRALCAGVAGTSFAPRRAEFLAALQQAFPRAQVSVEPDYAIALTGATEGAPGMIVIAGTGSAAYGENAAGQSHKTGAYGYRIDDSGSGYGVGRAALAAVLQAADGTGAPTVLTERILAALSLTSLAEIVPGVFGDSIDSVTIASLSRCVADAAEQEADPVAAALLMRAGGTLAQLAHAIAARLFPPGSPPFSVVRVGSLWNAGPALTDVFERSLRRFAPQAVCAAPRHEPVYGAVLRAISHALSPPA